MHSAVCFTYIIPIVVISAQILTFMPHHLTGVFFSVYVNIFHKFARELTHYWQNEIEMHNGQLNVQDDLMRVVRGHCALT